MQIYLIENGQKTGPFNLWDVRGRLERQEITPETMGWHDGCEKWLPLRELPALGYREQEPEGFPTELPDLPDPGVFTRHAANAGEEASTKPRPWSRFWARWFDLSLWFVLVALSLKAFNMGFDKFLLDPAMNLASLLLLLLAEAACLAATGTTPGKALFGIRVFVKGGAGAAPPFPVSMQRTLYVCALGNGLMIIYTMIVAWVFHHFALMRHGSTWWDRRLGLEVAAKPLSATRVLLFAAAFLGVQLLLQALVGKEVEPLVQEMLKSGKFP